MQGDGWSANEAPCTAGILHSQQPMTADTPSRVCVPTYLSSTLCTRSVHRPVPPNTASPAAPQPLTVST